MNEQFEITKKKENQDKEEESQDMLVETHIAKQLSLRKQKLDSLVPTEPEEGAPLPTSITKAKSVVVPGVKSDVAAPAGEKEDELDESKPLTIIFKVP